MPFVSDIEEQAFRINPYWPEDAGRAAQVVNQLAVSQGLNTASGVNEGTIYLTFGHVWPPLVADEDAAAKYLERGGNVEIDVRAEVMMTTIRAEELWTLLGRALGKTSE